MKMDSIFSASFDFKSDSAFIQRVAKIFLGKLEKRPDLYGNVKHGVLMLPDNIEDILGKPAFIFFYFLCGIVAALSQALPDPSSTIPMIGASGAISGVLGAYMVFFPKRSVRVAIPLGFFLQVLRLPAFVVLIFWFVLQLINSSVSGSDSGVAFGAHIGGFLAGVILAPMMAVLLRKKRN